MSLRWVVAMWGGWMALAAGAGDAPPLGVPWAVHMSAAASATDRQPTGLPAELRSEGPLGLATLSDYALRHNPGTRAAWAAAMADVAGIDVSRAELKPAVNLTLPASIAHNGGGAADASDTAVKTPAASVIRSLSPSLGLSWVLFDFGARASGVEAARWQAAASQLGYNRELQTVVSNVEQAYYGLLGARQLLAALQTAVDAAQASLDVAQARRRAGLATVGETAQAEAALADARLKALQAQAQARSAAGSLANAVGLPVNTPLPVADDLVSVSSAALWRDGRMDELLATARSARGDLAALDAQVQQGRAQLAAAEAQGKPSLSLSAQAGKKWSSAGNDGGTQQIGLTLSIPLFDGGLAKAQTQAARARLQQFTAQRDQQQQSVELEVWQSFQDAASADAVIDSAQAALRSASLAEEAARERYGAGVGSLLELIVAQSTTAQARVSLVQARYSGQLAMARLGYAVGSDTQFLFAR